jgi:hypothetical protein
MDSRVIRKRRGHTSQYVHTNRCSGAATQASTPPLTSQTATEKASMPSISEVADGSSDISDFLSPVVRALMWGGCPPNVILAMVYRFAGSQTDSCETLRDEKARCRRIASRIARAFVGEIAVAAKQIIAFLEKTLDNASKQCGRDNSEQQSRFATARAELASANRSLDQALLNLETVPLAETLRSLQTARGCLLFLMEAQTRIGEHDERSLGLLQTLEAGDVVLSTLFRQVASQHGGVAAYT